MGTRRRVSQFVQPETRQVSFLSYFRTAVSEVTGRELSIRDVPSDVKLSSLATKTQLDEIASRLTRDFNLDFLTLPNEWPDAETVGDVIDLIRSLIAIEYDKGSAQDSVRLSCPVFRWHLRDKFHVSSPTEFFRPFEDGPWKWRDQGRFAAKDMNCGHYFGLCTAAATAEIQYYCETSVVPDNRVLVCLDIDIDNVLDLTRIDVMQRTFSTCVEDPENRIGTVPDLILHELIEKNNFGKEVKGGNVVTDYIGRWAFDKGYQGILFFGARAIDDLRRGDVHNANRNFEPLYGYAALNSLRQHPEFCNVVLFSGATLVSSTRAFGCSRAEPQHWEMTRNPYFGLGAPAILELSTFDEHFQDEMRYSHWYASKPVYK
jgi:hypothetical protein